MSDRTDELSRASDSSATAAPEASDEQTAPAGDDSSLDLTEQMLGEFRLLRRLGRGGMADVYLAEQTSLKRQVAVKVLRADQLEKAGEQLLKRFRQEAKASGGLNHPNIVQVYSVGEEEGRHYIVQEYVQGPTLKRFLARKGPPELPLALRIMKQVASVLQVAADAGIVHRDIKPENIMITKKGDAKVADFGLALLMQREERLDLTQHGTTLGTPSYMSPEQVSGAKVDHRSDIYSFGVTCYHLFAGKPPFRGQTAMSVAVQHVNEEPQSLAKLRPDLPPALCEIIHTMMRKSPDERYQDAQSLLHDLKRVGKALKESPETASALKLAHIDAKGSRRTRRKRLREWSAKRPAALFVLSLLLVGSTSAGVGWLMRPRNPFDTPPPKKTNIPQEETPAEQFRLAMSLMSNEDAWQAVIDNSAPDDPEHYRAMEKLALVNLSRQNFGEAKKLFDQLAFLGGEHADLKFTGVVGQAVIASLNGDYSESQRLIEVKLREAWDLLPRPRRLDPDVENLLREAIARNQQQLGEAMKKDFDNLFQETDDQRPPLVPE